MSALREPWIKCVGCGRFIDSAEILGGFARFHHEPDSDRSREVNEWLCAACVCREEHTRAASAAGARSGETREAGLDPEGTPARPALAGDAPSGDS